jgi:hypothetical protein
MHADDNDAEFPAHDCGERFRAAQQQFFMRARIDQDRVLVSDGGGMNDDLGCARVFRAVLAAKLQTELLQSIGFERSDFIGTTYLVTELEQKRRDPAHPAARDADKMNAVPFLREQFLQIGFRRARHEWCIFPSP